MSRTSRIERALLDQKIDYRSHTAEVPYFIKKYSAVSLCSQSAKNKRGGEVENSTRFECLYREYENQGGEMTLFVEFLMKDGKV